MGAEFSFDKFSIDLDKLQVIAIFGLNQVHDFVNIVLDFLKRHVVNIFQRKHLAIVACLIWLAAVLIVEVVVEFQVDLLVGRESSVLLVHLVAR